jgi:polysaccharide biosynthesis/export protein
MRKVRKQNLALSAALMLAAAALQAQTAAPAASGSSLQLEQRYPRYVVQHADVLLLSFPVSPELNQTVTVQPDGYINLQDAGSVHIQGETIPEVRESIRKAYAGILNDPIVNVDLKDFQKPFFTVNGQVVKPGQYELRDNITVAEALAVAGGISVTTGKTQVFLYRHEGSMFHVEKVDLRNMANGKDANEIPYLRPGDMVYVPEKAIAKFRTYVPYSFGTIAGYENP